MPVDETNDKVHNFFEQESLSQGVHQSQFTGGGHPLLNSNLWFGSQREGTFLQYCHVSSDHPSDLGKDSENGREQHALKTPNISNFTQPAVKDRPRNLNRIVQVSEGLVSWPYQARSLDGDLAPDGCDSALRNISRSELQKVSENVSGSTRPSKSVETVDFLGRQCQLMRSQQPGMSQSQARPLPGFSDRKLLQQQYFYKQLQEIRQRQLQQLQHEPGQQNSGQFSAFAKQAAGDQATAVVNGTPMYDTSNYMWSSERMPQGDPKTTNSSSQAFMLGNTNMVRTGSSLQGFHNGLVLSQEQAHTFNSMGLMPPQFGQSTYSASLGGIREASGNPVNPFSNLQWGAQENTDMFTRVTGNQGQKTGMESNAFGSFYDDQSASFSGQVPASNGLSVSKQSFHGRNVFGQVSNALESVNSEMRSGNFQQGSSLMRKSPVQEFQRQEHVGWLGNMEEKIAPQTAPPQGSISLDPLEEKILYGGDTCVWDPAHGEQPLSNAFTRVGNMSAGSFGRGNHLEGPDCFNMFPSVQSGSWSALMLSAVAEASSSDTGMQDEWNGLSFQKAEALPGNPSELDDNGRQGAGWNDLNIQTANSLSSKPVRLFDDVNMTSSSKSAGFQQMTPRLAFEQSGQAENDVHSAHEFVNNDRSSESLRRSPKEGRWLEQNPEERATVDSTVHTPLSLGNSSGGAWRSQTYGQQESVHPEAIGLNALSMQSTWTHQQQPSMITYRTDGQPSSKMNSWNMNETLPSDGDNLQDDASNLQPSHSNESIVAMQLGRGCDVNVWQSDVRGSMRKNENQGWSSIPNLNGKLEQAKSPSGSPQVQHDGAHVNSASGSRNIPLEKTHVNSHFGPSSSSNMGGDNNVDKYQFHFNQDSSTNHPSKLADSHGNSRETCYLNVTPAEVRASNNFCHGQQAAAGDVLMDNTWSSAKDSPTSAAGSQKSSAHVVKKSSTGGPRRFLYHPMGELAVDVPQPSTSKHDMLSQGLQHAAIGEQKFLELGHMSQTKSAGVAVARATANSGKSFFGSNSQNRSKGPEDEPSRASPASSFDGPMNFYPPKETSQNMLEFLNKVDNSIVNAAKPLGSSSYGPSSDVSEAVTSGLTSGHMRSNQSSSSQGFGLHLAPPSGASAVPYHVFPSRHVKSDTSRNIKLEAGKGQTWLHGHTSMQSVPHPSEKSQQDSSCNKTAVTDTTAVAGTVHEFSSLANKDTRLQTSKTLLETEGSHYIQNQLQSQQCSGASGQAMGGESADLAYASQVSNRQAKSESSCRQNQDSQDGCLVEQRVPTVQAETAGKPASFDTNPRGETDFTSGLPFFARDNSITDSQTLPSTSANSSYIESSNERHTLVGQVSSQQGILQPNQFSPLLHNVWSNMSARRSTPGVPQMISRGPLQPISPTTTWVVQAVNDQNLRDRGGTSISELCPGSKSMQHLPPREDHQSRESPSQRIPSNRVSPIESFRHESLAGSHVHQVNKNGENQGTDNSVPSKTSNTSFQSTMESGAGSQPSYSLLDQMQAMKNSESDPNNSIKRLRGENDADASQLASRIGQRNVYGYSASNIDLTANSSRTLQHAPYSVLDGKSLSFSMEENKNRSANASVPSLSSNTLPQDMAGFDINKSHNYPASCFTLTPPHPSLRGAGHSHPNSQMANSWFEQFGTYRNGQFLTSDRFAVPQNSAKAAAQQFFFGRVSENTRPHAIVEQRSFSDASQVVSVTSMPSSTTVVAAKDHPSLVHVSQPDANSQLQVLVKQKKRKTASLEVLPWHKVVTHTSRSLQSISFAELRWASATNRQTEKIDDEVEMIDDMVLTPGPRRRIIFTTQLMQRIFCSLPAALLSADASSVYETATYVLAKLSLGDACSLVSSLVAALQVNDDKDSKTSVQTCSFGRLTACFLSELVEGFLDKAGRLEHDFLRLEKGPSLLDLRVECQDLERFSVINRFARFHGRGPAEAATTADSSASGPAAAPSLDAGGLVPRKLSPQRYVTAVPMPKNLPEGLQCHSL